jgi:heme/copper-type cytochrome/quinol oxidase subunit 1
MLAGLYYWFPKITGRMYSERLARWAFWLVFVGMNVTFFPMHIAGLLGQPRRTYTYEPDLGWTASQLTATIGSYLLAIGLLLVLAGVVHGLRRGAPAPDDPWQADTLEWATSSPPKPYNFAVIPQVHSLHPMWDERTRASMRDAPDERVIAEGKQTLMTSELDGVLERPVEMPEETLKPLLAAFGLLVAVVALLWGWLWLALIGAVLTGGTLAVWLLPPARTPAEAGVTS